MDIIRETVGLSTLAAMAEGMFGDPVKAVVDVEREVMAIDAELHADEEAILIDDGSWQEDLWGINLYPADFGTAASGSSTR